MAFPTKLILLILLAVLLILFVSGSAWMYHYTENDPKFCNSCHIMNDSFAAWEKGPHKDINCHSCHIQNLQQRATIVWEWAVGNHEKIEPHSHLDTTVCKSCHMSDNAKWHQVGQTAGHKVHVERLNLDCLQCHFPALHRFKPEAKDCRRCHSKIQVNMHGMGEFHCLACHSFLAGDVANIRPTRETCLHCHLNATMELPGAPGEAGTLTLRKEPRSREELEKIAADTTLSMDCTLCHKPHEGGKPTPADCMSCHPDALQMQTHKEMEAGPNCTDCHDQHHWSLKINQGGSK